MRETKVRIDLYREIDRDFYAEINTKSMPRFTGDEIDFVILDAIKERAKTIGVSADIHLMYSAAKDVDPPIEEIFVEMPSETYSALRLLGIFDGQ